MKVAIVGAGFYGTYISYKLSKIKNVRVDLFEKNRNICLEVAQNNQYRLHTGFHYPRSVNTINQTIEGFNLFLKEFKDFVIFPENNLYLINKKSKISFDKYKSIFSKLKVPYKEINLNNYKNYFKINNFQGGLNTKEGVIEIKKLISFFKKKIKNKVKIHLNSKVIEIDNLNGTLSTKIKNYKNYDFIINTTYCCPNLGLTKKKFSLKYEITGMVKLKNPFTKSIGLTVMDGNFCSLYPYDKKYSSISSVKFTPIFKRRLYNTVISKKKKIMKIVILKNILNHAKKDFLLPKKLKNISLMLSYKVKMKKDINDLRTSSYIKENRQISILCGKLDAALVIYNEIKKFIKK